MEQKISIFGKTYSLQFFEEVFSNQQIKNIILQASQRGTSPNFDIQKMRRTVNQKIESLVEIGTFQHFLDKQAQQQDKTEAYQLVAQTFPVQLVVRGDGNCFYRSFIVNYIFKIVFYQLKEELFQLIAKIWNFQQYQIKFEHNSVKINSEEFKVLSIRFLFDVFMKKAQNQINLTLFINQYNNQPEVDLSFIVICRNFINNYFSRNLRNPSKLGFIDEQDQVEIPVLLETYGSEAQNTIIPLSANAFNNVKLNFQNLYRDLVAKKFQTRLDVYNDQSAKLNVQNQVSVDVLFTKGHYNIIFDSQFSQQFCQDIVSQKKEENQSIISSVSSKLFNIFVSKQPESQKIQQNSQNQPFIQSQFQNQNQENNSHLYQSNLSVSSDSNQRQRNIDNSQLKSQSAISQSSSSSKLQSQSSGVKKNPFEINNSQIKQNSNSFNIQDQTNSNLNSSQISQIQQYQNISKQPEQSYEITNYFYSPPLNTLANKQINSQQQYQPQQNINQQNLLQQNINLKSTSQQGINRNKQNSQTNLSQNIKNYQNQNILQNNNNKTQVENQGSTFSALNPGLEIDENAFQKNKKRNEEIAKPALGKRNSCDICSQSRNTYDLLYICICQDCIITNLLNLKEPSLQILADLFRLVKNDKFCLTCFSNIPYTVSIESQNSTDAFKLICGNCQKNDYVPNFFVKLSNFMQEYSVQLNDVVSKQKQIFKNWEQSQQESKQNQNILSVSYIFQTIKDLVQNENRLNNNTYRVNLQNSMRNKTDAQRDSLIEFLTQTNRFKDFCFVCESNVAKSFELPLQNGGTIRLCVECIHEIENIYTAVIKNNGLTYLYCSLIDQKVILHMQNQNLSYYFNIKKHCYNCLEQAYFPFQVSKNYQLCFNCLSNQQEYLKNDDKLVALVKKQTKQFQKCLGCFQNVNVEDTKIDRSMYLCYVCSNYSIVKDPNSNCYQVLNRVYNRHFKVQENEICDYFIDEKENVVFLTESSSENEPTSLVQQENYDLELLKQKILDCPKCNYDQLPKRLFDSIQCTCKFEHNLSNKTISVEEGQQVYCLFCNSYINDKENNLSHHSLSAKSIIQHFNSSEINVKYFFKNKIKLVRCGNCKHLQSIQEQYSDYQF